MIAITPGEEGMPAFLGNGSPINYRITTVSRL